MLSLNSMLSFKSSESPLRISPVKKPIVTSRFSPWLMTLAYPLGRYLVMPFYFGRIDVSGQENLPKEGPIILAPTHRSRWDALVIPYAAGRRTSGRDLRFMVSADEVKGLQGWFIRRLGGFPVDTRHPTIASLRHGVEVLQNREALVIFPEGGIFRDEQVHSLKPGLARLALQAEASQPNLGVKIVPIGLQYSAPFVPWRCRARVNIGKPLQVADYHLKTPKQSAQQLTVDLEDALKSLMHQA
jgi:1-acyl-sn-glycerol-3-phosphate acyltransferase